jgi:oligopeptide/dipeptide ABC transporter ATP-binding protein
VNSNGYILRVENLKKYFPIKKGIIRRTVGNVYAVDDISFSIKKGETLGLVGESGCGKSTTARVILRLLDATGGKVFFGSDDILKIEKGRLRELRRDMQIVFQDPYASLNPRMTVGMIVGEPLIIHNIGNPASRKSRVRDLLKIVGLNPEHTNRYPHEFSGGQRQRIGVARALALNPQLIVCDEPISALDVSIQAQILNLLYDLQCELNLTYLFIAHDLSVVRHISNRVAVMYLGKIVEIADSRDIYENPFHPYTVALLSSVPIPDPDRERKRKHIILEGDVPSPINPPSGCHFHPRCPRALEICSNEEPPLEGYRNGSSHQFACWNPYS